MRSGRFALLAVLATAACGTAAAPADAALDRADATSPRDVIVIDASMGCSVLAACVGRCADAACAQGCRAAASPAAVAALQAQVDCVFGRGGATPPVTGACPTTGGGVCDPARPGFSPAQCEACIAAAQRVGGACDAVVTACQRTL